MTTVAFDIRQPAQIAHEIAHANQRLARERDVPDSVRGLVQDLAEAFAELDEEDWATVDPYLVAALQRAALRARVALDSGDEVAQRRALRVRLEQMRQVFRDLAEGQPVAEDVPAEAVARWLTSALDVPQHELADLVGVAERTWQRWISQTEAGRPDGDEAWRLRIVARTAQHLRHALTGPGVVAWFSRPRAELGDEPPAAVLDDPELAARLPALAFTARSSVAT